MSYSGWGDFATGTLAAIDYSHDADSQRERQGLPALPQQLALPSKAAQHEDGFLSDFALRAGHELQEPPPAAPTALDRALERASTRRNMAADSSSSCRNRHQLTEHSCGSRRVLLAPLSSTPTGGPAAGSQGAAGSSAGLCRGKVAEATHQVTAKASEVTEQAVDKVAAAGGAARTKLSEATACAKRSLEDTSAAAKAKAAIAAEVAADAATSAALAAEGLVGRVRDARQDSYLAQKRQLNSQRAWRAARDEMLAQAAGAAGVRRESRVISFGDLRAVAQGRSVEAARERARLEQCVKVGRRADGTEYLQRYPIVKLEGATDLSHGSVRGRGPEWRLGGVPWRDDAGSSDPTSEGLGLPSALVRGGLAPQTPPTGRGLGARGRPGRHVRCV